MPVEPRMTSPDLSLQKGSDSDTFTLPSHIHPHRTPNLGHRIEFGILDFFVTFCINGKKLINHFFF
jgi:hypothetical protein